MKSHRLPVTIVSGEWSTWLGRGLEARTQLFHRAPLWPPLSPELERRSRGGARGGRQAEPARPCMGRERNGAEGAPRSAAESSGATLCRELGTED